MTLNGDSHMEPSTENLDYYLERFQYLPNNGYEVRVVTFLPANDWELKNFAAPKVKPVVSRESRVYCCAFLVKTPDGQHMVASYLYRVFDDKRVHVNKGLLDYIEKRADNILDARRRTKNPLKYLATIEI